MVLSQCRLRYQAVNSFRLGCKTVVSHPRRMDFSCLQIMIFFAHCAFRGIQVRGHEERIGRRRPSIDRTNADKENEGPACCGQGLRREIRQGQRSTGLYRQSEPGTEFPVLDSGGAIVSSHDYSDTLQHTPILDVGIVFVDPECVEEASPRTTSSPQIIRRQGPLSQEKTRENLPRVCPPDDSPRQCRDQEVDDFQIGARI